MAERHRWIVSALVATMLLGIAGCAPTSPQPEPTQSEEPGMSQFTLEDAKAVTIQRREEIAAFLPEGAASYVTATTTADTLVPCTGENEYMWPGVSIAKIDGELDRAAVVEAIATEWESREDWFVERSTTEAGLDKVTLTNADGSYFSVGFHVDGTEFWVDGYSPCFVLPGGFVYGTEY